MGALCVELRLFLSIEQLLGTPKAIASRTDDAVLHNEHIADVPLTGRAMFDG